MVRNISSDGAMLDVTRPVDVAEQFTLALPAEGQRTSCHVVWRRQKRIGVGFDSGPVVRCPARKLRGLFRNVPSIILVALKNRSTGFSALTQTVPKFLKDEIANALNAGASKNTFGYRVTNSPSGTISSSLEGVAL